MADIEIRQGQQIDLDIGRTGDPIQLNLGDGSRTIDLEIDEKAGVTDYNLLNGKPSIEDVVLQGNKTFKQLGLETATVQEVEAILYLD